MMDYARSDTHYLLYVYDKMRNALHEKSNPETLNILRQSLKSSEQTSLKLYVKDLYSPEGDGANGWRLALGKCGVPLLPEQAAVFKAMHQWEDESVRYTLPQHMLIGIAKAMPLTPVGVAGCCNPMPSLIRLNLDDIVTLVNDTRREYQVSQKARIEELAKIQQEYEEKEKSWEARKKNGPLHIVFDGDDGLARKRTDIMVVEKSAPDFGLMVYRADVDVNSTAYKAAETVRKSLVLVAPMLPDGVGFKETEVVKPVVAEPVPVKLMEMEPIILADVKVAENRAKGKRKAVEEDIEMEEEEEMEEGEASPMRIDGTVAMVQQDISGRNTEAKKKRYRVNQSQRAKKPEIVENMNGDKTETKTARRMERVDRLAAAIAEQTGVPAQADPFDYSAATSAFTFVPPPLKKGHPAAGKDGKDGKGMKFQKPK